MQTHTGSCLCGVVRYRIDAPINELTHCHCKMCRKAHGAAFATYASVPLDAFHFLSGKDQLGVYHSSDHVTRTFCIRCGSNLQFVDNREHELGVAAGTLDSPLPAPPPVRAPSWPAPSGREKTSGARRRGRVAAAASARSSR